MQGMWKRHAALFSAQRWARPTLPCCCAALLSSAASFSAQRLGLPDTACRCAALPRRGGARGPTSWCLGASGGSGRTGTSGGSACSTYSVGAKVWREGTGRGGVCRVWVGGSRSEGGVAAAQHC